MAYQSTLNLISGGPAVSPYNLKLIFSEKYDGKTVNIMQSGQTPIQKVISESTDYIIECNPTYSGIWNVYVDSIFKKDIDLSYWGEYELNFAIIDLYNTCAYIKQSGLYSYEIDDITYKIEACVVNEINDDNIDNIFNDVIEDEDYFLLLKCDSILISSGKKIIPPYPKKSLIIYAGNISGSGEISMTGKGPKVLPEDILVFEPNSEHKSGGLLIPAYANNSKTITISHSSQGSGGNGINGTDYNCGSGGNGAHTCGSGSIQTTFVSGSGYSYGGGAGSGGRTNLSGASSDSKVDSTYPMIGCNGVVSGYYSAMQGVGNPNGTPSKGAYADYNGYIYSDTQSSIGYGVGGRIIIFTNSISNVNLTSQGIDSQNGTGYHAATGGASGGGSINIFYTNNATNITYNVDGGKAGKGLSNNNYAGNGGKGTYTCEQII